MKRLNDLYEQITPATSPEELSQKVMNTEIKMTARKCPSKAVAAILAAAVSVSALTLTAGAANGWDYAGIFRSIFGEEKTDNIMENIVPEATVLQDTIDIMDFELVAAAADNHGVLAILDIYSENGYKLIEEIDGEEYNHVLSDLFIFIDSHGTGGSGTSINLLEESEEKVRLSIRMKTEDVIKGKELTLHVIYEEKEEKVGEYIFDMNTDPTWSARFTADYSAEEIRYEMNMELSGEDHKGNTVCSKIKNIEVSPISLYFEGENFNKYFDTLWNPRETYAVLDSGEKVGINTIYSSGYEEDAPTGSTMLCLGYEEPVNPEEVCAVLLGDIEVEIK